MRVTVEDEGGEVKEEEAGGGGSGGRSQRAAALRAEEMRKGSPWSTLRKADLETSRWRSRRGSWRGAAEPEMAAGDVVGRSEEETQALVALSSDGLLRAGWRAADGGGGANCADSDSRLWSICNGYFAEVATGSGQRDREDRCCGTHKTRSSEWAVTVAVAQIDPAASPRPLLMAG